MLINLSKRESYFRVVIGALSITVGSHFLWFLLIPMGVMLIHTGLTSKCPITHLLHRETDAAKEHLFIDFLPKHNPQPVFIFKSDNQLAFANTPAKKLFPDLKTFQNLIDKDTAFTHE